MQFMTQQLVNDAMLEVDFKMENADIPSTSANANSVSVSRLRT
jgi:hypothetical protein